MPDLSPAEQQWLSAYREELAELFPDVVEQMMIFGSKARGDSTADSDLDILVIINEGDWRLKEAVAQPGHMLAIGTDVVPSFIVYTREEWEQRRKGESPLWRTITRDGIAVL